MRPALLIAALALIASPAAAQRSFMIAGERIAESDIVDARALPQIAGKPVIMITLTPEAAKRVRSVSQALAGRPLPITLNGRSVGEPVLDDPDKVETLQISGGFTMVEAEAKARMIAGKQPVPDALEDE